MKKVFCIVFCFLTLSFLLSAQTADRIEDLLNSSFLSYERAALFVLEAADLAETYGVSIISSPASSFRFAMDQKWLPKTARGNQVAKLDCISLLLMGSFNVKGGLFYSFFKNPHYAYRELVYKDVIQGRADPDMAVSGEMLLFLIGRILYNKSGSAEEYDLDKYAGIAREEAAASAAATDQERLAREEAERREQARLAREEAERREQQERLAREEAERREQERLAREALTAEINTQIKAQELEDTSARVTEQGITISLSNIQFMANSSELPASERRKLQEIARILQMVPNRRILVTGHTAMAGNAADRLRTSSERAAAVAAYLISLGGRRDVEKYTQGVGADSPIADNRTPRGMALNRRVEITILED